MSTRAGLVRNHGVFVVIGRRVGRCGGGTVWA